MFQVPRDVAVEGAAGTSHLPLRASEELMGHDYSLGLMAEAHDCTSCANCGDRVHRGDLDGLLCALCAALDEEDEL